MESAPTASESSPAIPPTPENTAPGISLDSNLTAAASVPLTKSAQKRIIKEARRLEQKLERRAREKELKKQKQKIRAAKRAAGELDDDEQPRKKARTARKKPFKARVVIDLGFDDKMQSKEIHSLCSQLNYAYSSNRKSMAPFESLLFTSLNGRTKEWLEEVGDKAYLRWKGVEWWEDGYESLWRIKEGEVEQDAGKPNTSLSLPTGAEGSAMEASSDADTAPSHRQSSLKEKVVYLTADSENEISELVEGETYIIGGIVDHNRYKNLCQNKAAEQGIRTARLPIGRYMAQLPTRKVLTVNQVFDILLRWLEERDWERALFEVMPKRKFRDGPKNGSSENHENQEIDREDDMLEDIEADSKPKSEHSEEDVDIANV